MVAYPDYRSTINLLNLNPPLPEKAFLKVLENINDFKIK